MMEPWIEASEPFVLVGPEGCGKDMIIRYAFSTDRAQSHGGRGRSGQAGMKKVKTSLAVLHCNARTTAEHVIAKVIEGHTSALATTDVPSSTRFAVG